MRHVRRTIVSSMGGMCINMTVVDVVPGPPLPPKGFDHRRHNAAPRSARGRR